MPKSIKNYNASTEVCDSLRGPCACGAWHSLKDWAADVLNEAVHANAITQKDLKADGVLLFTTKP